LAALHLLFNTEFYRESSAYIHSFPPLMVDNLSCRASATDQSTENGIGHIRHHFPKARRDTVPKRLVRSRAH
jgi:hypothetical protein